MEETAEDTQKSTVDNYTGISIKVHWQPYCVVPNSREGNFLQVSFNSKVDEGLRIQQLSGGQKSLVALATGNFSHCWTICSSHCFPFQCLPFKNAIQLRSICSMRYVLSSRCIDNFLKYLRSLD